MKVNKTSMAMGNRIADVNDTANTRAWVLGALKHLGYCVKRVRV